MSERQGLAKGLVLVAVVLGSAGCEKANHPTPATGANTAAPVRVASFECPAPESPDLLNEDIRSELLKRLEDCRASPGSAKAVGALGLAYHAADLLLPAEGCYLQCVQLKGSDAKWRYYLAVVSQELGKLEESRDNLERFLMDEPDYAPARYRLGQMSLQKDDLQSAAVAFLAMTNTTPPSAGGFLGLGLVYKRRDDIESAVRLLQQAIRYDPQLDDAYFQLSLLYRRIGRNDLADDAARHVRADRVAYQPPDPLLNELGPLQSGAKVLISRGYDAIDAKQYDLAIATFQRLLNQKVDHPFPKHYGALVGMARAYRESGRLSEAEAPARRAIEINATFPDARIELAQILLAAGRNEEALAEARAACSDPPSPAAYSLRAEAAVALSEWDEAIESYRRAIELVPMLLSYRQQLIELLERQERWDEAIAECDRVIDMVPGHPAAAAKRAELMKKSTAPGK